MHLQHHYLCTTTITTQQSKVAILMTCVRSVYVLCTSCLLGITHTNFKQAFWLCSAATSDVFSPTNYQLHITHVAYQYQSKYFSLILPLLSPTLQKNVAFAINQFKPLFAKNAPIKKLTTKISNQTEFTMSRSLSAHDKCQWKDLLGNVKEGILHS